MDEQILLIFQDYLYSLLNVFLVLIKAQIENEYRYLIVLNFRGFLNSRFSPFKKIRELKDPRKITTSNFDLAKFNGHRKIMYLCFQGS